METGLSEAFDDACQDVMMGKLLAVVMVPQQSTVADIQ
jgi:hypothetical protein